MISEKDIIELNKMFSDGGIVNRGSLDYAVKVNRRSKNWLRSAAVFTRAILIDHVFEDGNKRTAAAVIMLLMEMNNVAFDPERIPSVIIKILSNNITNVNEIERCIKHAII